MCLNCGHNLAKVIYEDGIFSIHTIGWAKSNNRVCYCNYCGIEIKPSKKNERDSKDSV